MVLSELAIAEALVAPMAQWDAGAIQAYEAIALESGFRVEPVSWRCLRRASELRAARPRLKMPDAIHVATAELAGWDAFVTNDKSLRNAGLPNVVVLDDLR